MEIGLSTSAGSMRFAHDLSGAEFCDMFLGVTGSWASPPNSTQSTAPAPVKIKNAFFEQYNQPWSNCIGFTYGFTTSFAYDAYPPFFCEKCGICCNCSLCYAEEIR
jgi:hypothetical protein